MFLQSLSELPVSSLNCYVMSEHLNFNFIFWNLSILLHSSLQMLLVSKWLRVAQKMQGSWDVSGVHVTSQVLSTNRALWTSGLCHLNPLVHKNRSSVLVCCAHGWRAVSGVNHNATWWLMRKCFCQTNQSRYIYCKLLALWIISSQLAASIQHI